MNNYCTHLIRGIVADTVSKLTQNERFAIMWMNVILHYTFMAATNMLLVMFMCTNKRTSAKDIIVNNW